MKNTTFIIAITTIFVVSASLAFAQGGQGGSGGNSAGTQGASAGAQDQMQDRDQVRDPSAHTGDEPLQAQDRNQDMDQLQDRTQDQVRDPVTHTGDEPLQTQDRDRAQDVEQLHSMVEERQRILQDEATGSSNALRPVLENQNHIRLAAHTMIAAADLTGGIGTQLSQLAQEVNDTVQRTIQAERRIQSRSAASRLFFGGDDDAARELEADRLQIQDRVRDMQQLVETCSDCDEQVRATLREQLQSMGDEHERLRQLAADESGRRGLFDYLFGWLF